MYKLYSTQCDKKGLEKVSADKYRKMFDYDFNLGFHRPKKDQCEICIAHRNRQGFSTDEDNQVYESHLKNKVMTREMKDKAKLDACNSQTNTACAFDMQQILLCPHGQSSSFFYKRRLGVYNLTVYDYKKGDAYCFMWPESEGRRGSYEVATCLFKYIEVQTRQGVKDIIMFSDNCAGQNRNRFARAHFHLNSLTHVFLEKGHTETENDSVHATIERKVRNIQIYSPEQWLTAVRTARVSIRPYVVTEMTRSNIIDFKGMALKVRNLTIDDNGGKISWSKVRQVLVKADDPSAIHIKTCYDGQPQRLDLNRRKRVSGGGGDAPSMELLKGITKPGMPELKKRDLLALCNSGQISASYRAFYESLPIGDEADDSATED
ncbi:guanine nucleotide-binding protein g(s) subunit alpha [Plakobranchus ocellatus]|uniref:Guanine nucleotide-binding protein g(S) subunit alpha n=1 Tax=Plakobranchus ocellatus TaxID=259542 RepID=A0AAV4AI93_9GAST|nr:guanine nucleotide-binding protein g(s) subunit alpha [Plakobranchus ocellatus]